MEDPFAISGPPVAKRRKLNEDDSYEEQDINDVNVAEILRKIENPEEEDTREHITSEMSLKRHIRALEKKIRLNEELRIKFENEPERFLSSEVDLDEEIQMFQALAAHPKLLKAFREFEGSRMLVSLLSHPNPDIALSVVKVFADLTDPEVLAEGGSDIKEFMGSLLDDFDLLALVTENLERINEAESQSDFEGVSNLLQVVDNLVDAIPQKLADAMFESKSLLTYLFKRFDKLSSKRASINYNDLFCAEIVAVLIQSNEGHRIKFGAPEPEGFNAVDRLLVAMSAFKKREWRTVEEEEYVMNIRNALEVLLLEPANRKSFADSQGMALMVRILSARTKIAPVALSLVSLAVVDNVENVTAFIQQGGLARLSGLLMGRGTTFKAGSAEREQEIESVLGILVNLCELATGNEQMRLMAKFFEDNCEKLRRLMTLRSVYYSEMLESEKIFIEEDNWRGPVKDYGRPDSVNLEPTEADLRLMTPEELTIYEERGQLGLLKVQSLDRILLKLANMGNDLMTTQVHVLLDTVVSEGDNEHEGDMEGKSGQQRPADGDKEEQAQIGGAERREKGEKVLGQVCRVLREYADHLFTEEQLSERQRILDALDSLISSRKASLQRAEQLREVAALKEVEEEKSKRKAEARERWDESKRRRVQRRMQKYSRELERREAIEEQRWARKRGAL